jgi:hypothetical protein
MAIPAPSGINATVKAGAGAPTTGTWARGDLVADGDGVYWRCVTAGTPGTWEALGRWGGISGTLSNQTDLQAALDGKIGAWSSVQEGYRRHVSETRGSTIQWREIFILKTSASNLSACTLIGSIGTFNSPCAVHLEFEVRGGTLRVRGYNSRHSTAARVRVYKTEVPEEWRVFLYNGGFSYFNVSASRGADNDNVFGGFGLSTTEPTGSLVWDSGADDVTQPLRQGSNDFIHAGNPTTLAADVTQAEAEAGAATTRRWWTAQRVAQAIAAQGVPADKIKDGAFDFSTFAHTRFYTIIGPSTNRSVIHETDDGIGQADIQARTYGVNGGGIFHGSFARGTRAAPARTQAGDIIAGYGGRCYDGTAFQDSSPVSMHWVATEDQYPAARGMALRLLSTPKGAAAREERAVLTDHGVWWIHDEWASWDLKNDAHNQIFADARLVLSAAEKNVSLVLAGYGNRTMGVRCVGARGTPNSPAAVQGDDWLGYFAGHGHDGSAISAGASALLAHKAAGTWSSSDRRTYTVIEGTPHGSTAREEWARWQNREMGLRGALTVGWGVGSDAAVSEVGRGRSADGFAVQDLYATSGDWSSRLARSPGANGAMQLRQRGTGTLLIQCDDAAFIEFSSSGVSRGNISPSTGQWTINGKIRGAVARPAMTTTADIIAFLEDIFA